MTYPHAELQSLIATMATLRGPGGCPWDQEQTHLSLVTHLLEEVFELVEALESGTRAEIMEELGDVLYQVLFHADIAAADPDDPFDIDDVARALEAKMRERHPHVFAEGLANSVAEVIVRWDEIKAEQNNRASVVEGIPGKLSALARAASVQKRAKNVLPQEPRDQNFLPTTEAELGETLFALVAHARAHGLDPERALREHTRGFEVLVREAEEAASGEAGLEKDKK